ncbi:MAG: hypothetical protein JNL58_31225 [Planctomyces sp.]|nr:hypothetical protein [Planctomyces sp.]
MRIIRSGLIGALFLTGCATSMLEQRVVDSFSDALKEDNEAALRNAASSRFEEKALRSDKAFRDLEILNLPDGKLSVVETEKVDKNTRMVIVKEEDGTKYQFRLVRDHEKRRWVVDDVLFRQQKKGTRATKSTTEVMDLLLTLREFLDTWEDGNRDDILQVVSADLRSDLEQLPEPWLHQLIGRITTEYHSDMARRPEAQLNEKDAVVKLPAKNGFILMRIVREDDSWKVADVEVHNKKIEDHPGSIRRQVLAVNAVCRFLDSYRSGDMNSLSASSSPEFFEGSLQYANLEMIPLPDAAVAPDDFEIRSFAGQLTVMIPQDHNIYRLDLKEVEKTAVVDRVSEPEINEELVADDSEATDSPKTSATKTSATAGKLENRHQKEFVIREVTIYDRQTQQQRILSSAFTAPNRATLYMSSLESLDLELLTQMSSSDFARGTWNRVQPELISSLPLGDLPRGEMTIQNSRMRGLRTEMELQAESGQLLTVILAEEAGYLRVEDVQYPGANLQIVSLRNQLEMTVPLLELASAWERSDIENVQKNCSTDFTRLVWSNVSELPTGFQQLPSILRMPIENMKISDKTATVALQPAGKLKTTVRLVSENGFWVVDEMAIQKPDGTTVEVRASLRQEIAQRFLDNPLGTIEQASHSMTSEDGTTRGVVHAHNQVPSARKANFTIAPSGSTSSDRSSTRRAAVPVEATEILQKPIREAEPRTRVQPLSPVPNRLAEVHEEDGVVYFNGAPEPPAKKSAPGQELPPESSDDSSTLPDDSGPALNSEIRDPSDSPIDIE